MSIPGSKLVKFCELSEKVVELRAIEKELKSLNDELVAAIERGESAKGTGYYADVKVSPKRIVRWKEVFEETNGAQAVRDVIQDTEPTIHKKAIVGKIR